MDRLNRDLAEGRKKLQDIQKQMSKDKAQEIARQERSNELLEINAIQNKEIIKLHKTEVVFLENIDGNTATLVQLLGDLEKTNQKLGNITKENMVQIQQKLDEIIGNSAGLNVSELLLEETKKQIIEKGVGFGIQFIITGLKLLFKANVVE